MYLVERDYSMIRLMYVWGFCQGRHIKVLAGFSGQRACDRRLKKLADSGLIERKRLLYGVAGLYTATNEGKKLIGVPAKKESIKLDQIHHDITVLDTVIYCIGKYKLSPAEIISEKMLHSKDGFSVKKHRPDFVFHFDNKIYCSEIELTLKAKDRLQKNIKDNFLNYDKQLWFVPDYQNKILKILNDNLISYPNIEIYNVEEVNHYVKSI